METPSHNNSRPIWIYVLNFAALTILGLAVVIAANMALNKAFEKSSWFHTKLRKDWTSNHVFTLAPSSVKLVEQVDAKNQPWELAMYDPVLTSGGDPSVTATQVRDLLDEYAGASRMIKVRTYGVGDRDELEQKIRDRFSNEIKPYNTALDHADSTLKELKGFFTTEAAKLGAVSSAAGVDPQEADMWHRMQGGLEKQVPEELEKARHDITNQLNSTLPEYSQAVTKARQAMNDVVKVLQDAFIAAPESPDFKTLSAPAKAYFTENLPAFKAELDKVQKVAQELSEDNLKPLAMDAIRSSLQPKAVVIFAPSTVKIVTPSDMIHVDMGADQNASPTSSFAGEQAISTTILNIVRPEKPKVVFVSASPSNLVQGAYSDFAGNLTAANFDVKEWSPASQDPGNAAPPAIGKGVVWVVFPPPPFDMQAMQMGQMPNTAPLVAAVRHHIEMGGNALFLAESGGRSPVMPGMGGDNGQYAFNDITSRFGVNVKSQFTIVRQQQTNADETRAMPMVEAHTFNPSEITTPVQGLPTMFFVDRTTGQGGAAPLEISKSPPAGTDVKALLTVNSSEYWATTNPTPTSTHGEGDYDGPLTIMAAASQKKGADEQRIVVVGNAQFANNWLMQAVVPTEQGLMVRFPGNGELSTNSVMWLAGYENMIAVSAKAEAGARIKDMQPATVITLDVVLILGLPILLMVLGGSIYFIRRR